MKTTCLSFDKYDVDPTFDLDIEHKCPYPIIYTFKHCFLLLCMDIYIYMLLIYNQI